MQVMKSNPIDANIYSVIGTSRISTGISNHHHKLILLITLVHIQNYNDYWYNHL